MGSLFTTADGTELTGLTAGEVFLDFVAGTVTAPDGTVTNMNKNLNDLGLNQCNSIGVWTSDADSVVHIGSALSLADHQLAHVLNNIGFSSVRITIPANSTPDASNQVFFQASTDGWLGYSFPEISHQRGIVPATGADTSTDTNTTYLSKHIGAYNQFLITTHNTGGSNSIDLQIEFSENGSDWFLDSGYTTSVTIGANSYNAFASEVEHHFYRARIVSTSTGNHSTFQIHYNFVKDRGV